MFLFWQFSNTFSNPRALIALGFNLNFRFWERIAINVNKDIEKVFICLIWLYASFFGDNFLMSSQFLLCRVFANIFFDSKSVCTLECLIERGVGTNRGGGILQNLINEEMEGGRVENSWQFNSQCGLDKILFVLSCYHPLKTYFWIKWILIDINIK